MKSINSITNFDTQSKKIAIISIFSVIYAIMRILPSFPLIGVPGASFSLADILIPVYAIIAGPYIAAVSIGLGTFLGFVFGKPLIFLGWDFAPATFSALFIGLIIHKNRLPAAIMFALGLIIFIMLPHTELLIPITNQISIPYNWMHILALLVLISPIGTKSINLIKENSNKTIFGLFIIAIIGTLFQHIIGGIVFVSTLGIYLESINPEAFPGIWKSLVFIYPIERLAIALAAAMLGTPILKTLRSNK